MTEIKFSRDQTEQIVDLIQAYFSDKLDSEIGRFDAEFLLDFFSKEIGGLYYNQALLDAEALLRTQFDSMGDSLAELEKLTPSLR